MLRIRLHHVNWHTVLLQPADGPSIEAYVISLPPDITKGGKTTGKPETVYAATARFRQVLEARGGSPWRRTRRHASSSSAPRTAARRRILAKRWRELFGLAGPRLRSPKRIGVAPRSGTSSSAVLPS